MFVVGKSVFRFRLCLRHCLRKVAGAIENFLHLPGEAVGFVDAANLGIAVSGRAQHLRELAVAVETFVVQLDDEDVVEAFENFLEAVGERVDVLDVQTGNRLAHSTGAGDGFADRTEGGTPAYQEDLAFVRTDGLGFRKFPRELAKLVATLGRHLHVQFG